MAIAATNLCVRSSSLKTIETPSLPRSSSFSSPANSPFSKSLRGRIPRHHLQVSLCLNNRFNINNARKRAVRVFCASIRKLAETEALSLDENPRRLTEKIPSSTGVYAMLDKNGDIQFIGVSLRISHSVLSHLRHVPDLCGAVKIAVVENPRRTGLSDVWRIWMDEHLEASCSIPAGNESWNMTWREKEIPVKDDLCLRAAPYFEFQAPLEELIQKLSKENKALAFIRGSRNAPRCNQSLNVLYVFYEQMIDYETVDVFDDEHNRGLRKVLKTYTGYPTFPQIFLRGNFIGGLEELEDMAEKGKLYDMFHK